MTPARLPAAVAEALRGPMTRLLFANMVAWGLATFIAVWLLQPYWQQQGVGLRWFGLLWAATLLTVGAVGRVAPALTRHIGQRGAMLVLTLTPIVGYAGMAATGGAGGIGFGFLFYVSRGLNAVNLREAFNHEIPGRLRATINSVASGVFRLGYAAIGPLVGLLVDRAGIDAALAALAGLFGLAFAVLAVPLLRRLPRARKPGFRTPGEG